MTTTKQKSVNAWGVYYIPSKEGKLFAGLMEELIQKFDDQNDAINFCESCNLSGYLDEMHIGYRVKPIY